ncbi:MAG: class I mannose-6-phosphate isomerase [Clostridia bacterium]|nr:class I mannose-6-phosphate isomerase [Clostridia bacterium]
MNAYPLKLTPYKKGVVWGGTTLKNKYGKDFDGNDLGETWELSVREKENSVISNGIYKGMTLKEYLGNPADYPLLVKFLDANDSLSVQVHPQKTEMWYIVEAQENAQLVYGLNKSYNRDLIKNAIESGTLEEHMNYINVKAGEVYFIPSGLTHAICKGIVIAEIQENSDITYRLYDYNRPQADGSLRELHVTESLDTIKNITEEDIHRERYSLGKISEYNLANCKFFTVDKYDFTGEKSFENDKFRHILCLDGEGYINDEKIAKGDSFYIPEGLKEYTVKSESAISLIISYTK